jgi:hypothetical protein
MRIVELKKDLFHYFGKKAFVHCISADYAMGAGIAVPIADRFSLRPILDIQGDHSYPDCIFANGVFNLVTKKNASDKPTYRDLEKSLEKMKVLVKKSGIKDVAMPRIGCGLDGLEWIKVREIIEKVFVDTNIDIVVCYL